MILILKNLIITTVCLIASFLNYCLLQIGITFFIPITILPIFCAFIFGYRIPALVILAIGVVDDAMLNVPIGVFSLVYLFVVYIILTFLKNPSNPMASVYIFAVLYTVVNFLALMI